jgi:hypothetical protein
MSHTKPYAALKGHNSGILRPLGAKQSLLTWTAYRRSSTLMRHGLRRGFWSIESAQ